MSQEGNTKSDTNRLMSVEELCRISEISMPIIVAEMGFLRNELLLMVFPNPLPAKSLKESESRASVQMKVKMIRESRNNLNRIIKI